MTNVCKNFFYYIKKTRIFIKAAIVFFLITIASLVSGIMQMSEYTLEEFLGSLDTCTMFSTITIIVLVAISLGNEFKHKTSYYLVMNGHSRSELFFGKLIAVLPYILLLGIIQCIIMYALLVSMTGSEFVSENIHHYLLNSLDFIIIYISYAILSLSFSFMTRSTIGGIGGSIIVIIVYNVIYLLFGYLTNFNMFSYKFNEMFGMFTFRYLLVHNNDISFQLSILALYILLSAVYMLIGYNKFRKDDLI